MYTFKYRILKNCVLIIAVLSLYTTIIYSENNVQINYYTGGKEKFELQSIPKNLGYKIRLTGSSKYKNIWFQISKSGKKHDIKLHLENKEKFDYYYYFKDGAGTYKITVFGVNNIRNRYSGLCYFTIQSSTNIPHKLTELKINNKIIEYVDSVMGKKVGRGECWDLAQAALDYYNADWKRTTQFGIPLDPDKDEIIPGDIVQMYNVKLKYENKTEYFGLPQHTAIIYKVYSEKNYEIAHQNVAGKRYMLKSDFKMEYMYSGSVRFYRPISGLVPVE